MGDGGTEGLSAVGDGGQAAISFTPEVDSTVLVPCWIQFSLCLVAQSCPVLGDPMVFSPPGSSIHGILQARILEWVAIPCSRRSSQLSDQTQVSLTAGALFTF